MLRRRDHPVRRRRRFRFPWSLDVPDLQDARERMRELLIREGVQVESADVTTTCVEPGTRPLRVVRGGRSAHAVLDALVPDLPELPMRRDVLAALSDLLVMCRAARAAGEQETADIEAGLLAVFNAATGRVVSEQADLSLPGCEVN